MSRPAVWTAAGALTGLALTPMPRAPVAAALLGGCARRLARMSAERAARAHAAAIERSAPEALDLLALCAVAGMGIDPALRMVASATQGPLREPFAAAVRALDVGMPRAAAYEELVGSSGGAPEIRSLVRALLRSERYGVPVSIVLSTQAADARDRQAAAVRERAMSAPVRMLFPLTLCFLPAFILLAIAPSVLVALRSFDVGL